MSTVSSNPGLQQVALPLGPYAAGSNSTAAIPDAQSWLQSLPRWRRNKARRIMDDEEGVDSIGDDEEADNGTEEEAFDGELGENGGARSGDEVLLTSASSISFSDVSDFNDDDDGAEGPQSAVPPTSRRSPTTARLIAGRRYPTIRRRHAVPRLVPVFTPHRPASPVAPGHSAETAIRIDPEPESNTLWPASDNSLSGLDSVSDSAFDDDDDSSLADDEFATAESNDESTDSADESSDAESDHAQEEQADSVSEEADSDVSERADSLEESEDERGSPLAEVFVEAPPVQIPAPSVASPPLAAPLSHDFPIMEDAPVAVLDSCIPFEANGLNLPISTHVNPVHEAIQPVLAAPPTICPEYKKMVEPLSDWSAHFLWKVITTGMNILRPSFASGYVNRDYPPNPPAGLSDAIQNLLLSTSLQPSAVVLALWYISRLPVAYGTLPYHRDSCEFKFRAELLGDGLTGPDAVAAKASKAQRAPFRLFLNGVMLANKWLDDNTFSNRTWHQISQISIRDLNTLEERTLHLLGHDLSVDASAWSNWLLHLRTYHTKHTAYPAPIGPPGATPHSIILGLLDDLIAHRSPPDSTGAIPEPIFLGLEERIQKKRDMQAAQLSSVVITSPEFNVEDTFDIDLDEDGPLREEYAYVPESRRRKQAAERAKERERIQREELAKRLPPPAKWSPAEDPMIIKERPASTYLAVGPTSFASRLSVQSADRRPSWPPLPRHARHASNPANQFTRPVPDLQSPRQSPPVQHVAPVPIVGCHIACYIAPGVPAPLGCPGLVGLPANPSANPSSFSLSSALPAAPPAPLKARRYSPPITTRRFPAPPRAPSPPLFKYPHLPTQSLPYSHEPQHPQHTLHESQNVYSWPPAPRRFSGDMIQFSVVPPPAQTTTTMSNMTTGMTDAGSSSATASGQVPSGAEGFHPYYPRWLKA